MKNFKDNWYFQQNSTNFCTLIELLEKHNIREVARKLNAKGRKREKTHILPYKYLKDWIDEITVKLKDQFYTLQTKIVWIFNGIVDFPVCETCKSSENFKKINTSNLKVPYNKHCCLKCAANDKNIIQQRKLTKLERYGNENFSNIEKAKQTFLNHKRNNENFIKQIVEKREQTCLKKYGCINPMKNNVIKDIYCNSMLKKYGVKYAAQSDIILDNIKKSNLQKYNTEFFFQSNTFKQKAEKTCIEKYGFRHAMQSNEIQKKQKQKYIYEGIYFDSFPEVAYYFWLKDNNISFEYQPNVQFDYEFEGKTHVYMPDFKVNDEYVELKGDHFLKEDGTWQNPWDHSLDALYEAKHQCAIKNNVKILYTHDYQKYIKYFTKVNNKKCKQYKGKQ